MRLLLDIGDDGKLNHPANRNFLELLQALQPMCGEVLGMIEEDLERTDGAA